MFPEIIFQNLGSKWSPFLTKDQKRLGSGVPFLALCQKGDHLDPNFEKIISSNIFDHEEDTLGIILSPF